MTSVPSTFAWIALVFSAASLAISACALFLGWKLQALGKRRAELAEETLLACQDAIDWLRGFDTGGVIPVEEWLAYTSDGVGSGDRPTAENAAIAERIRSQDKVEKLVAAGRRLALYLGPDVDNACKDVARVAQEWRARAMRPKAVQQERARLTVEQNSRLENAKKDLATQLRPHLRAWPSWFQNSAPVLPLS